MWTSVLAIASCVTTGGAGTARAATAAPAPRASASGRTWRPAKVQGPTHTHGRAHRHTCAVPAQAHTHSSTYACCTLRTHLHSETHACCVCTHSACYMHTHTLHTARAVYCTGRHVRMLRVVCILIHTHIHTHGHRFIHTWSHTVVHTHQRVRSNPHIPTFPHPLILTLYPLILPATHSHTLTHAFRPSAIHTCVHTIRHSVTHIGAHSIHTYTPIFTLTDMSTWSHTLRSTPPKNCVCPHSHIFILKLTATHLDVYSHTCALVPAHPWIHAHTCSGTHTLCSNILVPQHSGTAAPSA